MGPESVVEVPGVGLGILQSDQVASGIHNSCGISAEAIRIWYHSGRLTSGGQGQDIKTGFRF
jgi:hypothetical protein